MAIPQPVGAIVLCLGGTGLAVARTLGRHGVQVAGIDTRRWEIGHFSRFLSTSTELSMDAVLQMAGTHRPVLLPCGDLEIQWTVEHREALAPHVRLPGSLADGSALNIVNKRRYYARCLELGINMPRTWLPTHEDDVTAIGLEACFPVLVKPAFGYRHRKRFGGRKLLLCHDADELRRAVWAPEEVVIQEQIPGPESEILVFAVHIGADGTPGPHVTARKLRQLPQGYGSGTRVRTEHDPEVVEHSLALLTALNFRGPCGVEWKRANGKLWHIETNPRPVLWYALAEQVTLDAWAELSGQERMPPTAAEAGIEWQYFLRDLWAAPLKAWRTGDVFCLLAKDDLKPTLTAPFHAAAQALSMRFGKK